VQTGAQDAQLIVFPGFVSGNLDIHSESKFQAYEVNLRRKRYRIGTCAVEGLVGYRGATLDDSIRFSSSTLGLSGPLLNASIALNEAFVTENQFHGGQLGLRWVNQRCCDWSAEFLAKVGLGNTQSHVTVTGTTTASLAGQSQTTQAGLLAQGTNIRSLEQNEFSTLSEFGVSIRRHFPCDLTMNLGYSFLHWSDVLRAGETIDPGVNPSQIPPNTLTGTARPELQLDSQAFWAQGLTVGLEYLF
ncbi:MAG: BBP7 family outer membrane beta-barrel protein, partial [Planctomycetota bacterium]|nr:BBP7 family outer membrane beta-barrel protein [Planctomycetota bacterium]